MQNTNVQELDIKSLKSLAYDLLVQGENIQNNLKIVNLEIARRLQPIPPATETPNNPILEKVEVEEVKEGEILSPYNEEKKEDK